MSHFEKDLGNQPESENIEALVEGLISAKVALLKAEFELKKHLKRHSDGLKRRIENPDDSSDADVVDDAKIDALEEDVYQLSKKVSSELPKLMAIARKTGKSLPEINMTLMEETKGRFRDSISGDKEALELMADRI